MLLRARAARFLHFCARVGACACGVLWHCISIASVFKLIVMCLCSWYMCLCWDACAFFNACPWSPTVRERGRGEAYYILTPCFSAPAMYVVPSQLYSSLIITLSNSSPKVGSPRWSSSDHSSPSIWVCERALSYLEVPGHPYLKTASWRDWCVGFT